MANLKKVVIWALIIVNVCFLAVFLWRANSDSLHKKEMLENLSTLFKQNGIYMNTDTIQEDGMLAELITSRDPLQEEKLAETFLGPTTMENQGGSIYSYRSDKGQARFSNGGEFDITFTDGIYNNTGGAESAARRLLQLMKIDSKMLTVSGQQGDETVTAFCSWKNKMIFNCRITFVYEEGSLVKISGNHAANITPSSDKTDMSSCATALTLFLNAVKSDKYSCAEIFAVDTGYIRTALGDHLRPAWRIITDTGAYYVNAITGDIERDT